MEAITTWYRDYVITTDKTCLQPKAIHHWLATESHWAKGVAYEVVERSFNNSFMIGALDGGIQIGGARLVTDYATFGYLADVYVLEAYRSQGISKEMMRILMNLDWVKDLRRLLLATLDAHGLYEQYGFTKPVYPERMMEIFRPLIYKK